MICPRCGIINPDDTERCKRCQGSLARPPARSQEVPPQALTEAAHAAPEEQVVQDAAEEPGHAEQPDPADQASPEPAPEPAGREPPGPAYPAPQDWQAPDWPAPPSGPSRWNPPGAGPSVPSYMLQAVLCTVLLFPVGGIIAIVYGVRVNRRLAIGDWDGASHASRMARTWCWISVAVGFIGLGLIAAGILPNPSAGR